MHPGLRHVLLNSALGGNDANTVLLLHFNGRDGDTTTIDSSRSAKAVTFVSGAVIDDSAFWSGGSSLQCGDGVDDYVYVEDSADFAFGTGDFTIDFRIKRAAVSGASENTFGQGNAGLTGGYHYGQIQADNTFKLALNDDTVTAASTATIADTNWHHIACVRKGADLAVAVDGNWGSITNIAATAVSDSGARFAIGELGEFTGGSSYNGWHDQFRISKGIARWTPGVPFVPPTRPYSLFPR